MGSLTEMGGGSEAYRISKTALNAVTRIVFNEVRGNIKINSVCPGWVRTEMGGRSVPRVFPKVRKALFGLPLFRTTDPAAGSSGTENRCPGDKDTPMKRFVPRHTETGNQT